MAPAPPARPRTPKTFQLQLRLEDEVAERADRLLDALTRARPDLKPFLVSRNAMLRAAVLRGLDAYEADAGLGPLPAPEPPTRGAKRKSKSP